MANIFISYASVDRSTARRLADALEARGWSVWWDHRSLRGGQYFDRIIEEAISTAKVVVVIWSQNSIGSDWVRAEAGHALDENKLVPLRIDRVILPLRFRNIHTIDLSSWTGQTEAEPFERLLETLSYYLGPSSSSTKTEQSETRTEPSSQAEPTDGERRFSVSGNYQPTETVPSADPPRALPNSDSFPASIATEHRASTADVAAIQAAYERGEYATALSLARPAADQGHAEAQNWLGRLYQNGWGVKQDYAEALRWYQKAVDQGLPEAQSNIGWLYQNGWGVKQDYAEALRWYQKAADQGNALAQNNIGAMHANGWGVKQDYAEALRWYQKAADQGNALAQNNIGAMHANGWGVKQDYAEALRWYELSAKKRLWSSFSEKVKEKPGRIPGRS